MELQFALIGVVCNKATKQVILTFDPVSYQAIISYRLVYFVIVKHVSSVIRLIFFHGIAKGRYAVVHNIPQHHLIT